MPQLLGGPHAAQHHCLLAGSYLEEALAAGVADPALYEQELAMLYLQRLTPTAAGVKPELQPSYEKLKRTVSMVAATMANMVGACPTL